MNAVDTPHEPYRSARDLPSLRELQQNIEGLEQLFPLCPTSKQAQLHEELQAYKAEHNRISHVVDSFYEKFGSRNWMFTSDLSLNAIEPILEIDDIDSAEEALITYYKSDDHVKFWLNRLAHFDAMKPRMPLLRAALEDYLNARNYSVVYVLIAVMDGFVNDFDKQTRKGLHARDSEEMFAWDCIVGHHMGLTNAHRVFNKSWRKTETAEVHDLYRHGIMHGMITNFDNSYTSTKAWNHLFAIGDWADSQLKEAEKASAPPDPSLEEVVQHHRKLQEDEAKRSLFQPYKCAPNSSKCGVLHAAEDLFSRWSNRQWGLVGLHFMQVFGQRPPKGQLAVEAKSLYEEHSLEEWSIQNIEHFGSMAAHVHAFLTVNGRQHSVMQRWLHVDGDFKMVDEWEDGHWVLASHGPSTFLIDEA